MRVLYLVLLSSLFFPACTDQRKKQSPKEKFDQLEKIFSHANWQMIRPKDTSCFYFERMTDTQYDIYQFRITKGDSSETSVSLITASGDSVRWDRRGRYLIMAGIDSSKVEWAEPGNSSNTYVMQRISDNQLKFHFSGQPEIILNKTLALPEFLDKIRKEYESTLPVDSSIAAPVQ